MGHHTWPHTTSLSLSLSLTINKQQIKNLLSQKSVNSEELVPKQKFAPKIKKIMMFMLNNKQFANRVTKCVYSMKIIITQDTHLSTFNCVLLAISL